MNSALMREPRWHRPGRDSERLQEIGADGEGHDRRDDEDLDVLPPGVPRRRRKEPHAELHRFLVKLLEPVDVLRLEQRGIAVLESGERREVAVIEDVLRVDAVAGQVGLDQLRLGEDLFGFGGEEEVEHGRRQLRNDQIFQINGIRQEGHEEHD